MSKIELTHFQLGQIISTAVEIGVSRATEKKAFLSKRAADIKYGRRTVNRWIEHQKIQPIVQKRRVKLDADRLNELSKVDELFVKFIDETVQN